jgi:hypothetical protein
MFTKSLIAALIVASTAIALTSKASARPEAPQTPATPSYMDRASQNHDNGGN